VRSLAHISRLAAGAMALLWLALGTLGLAVAQGPAPQNSPISAGPYEILLEESLSSLSLGHAEFTITVREAATGRPVPNARVALWLQSPRSTDRTQSLALGGPDAPGRYAATLNLDAPGQWLVAVEVLGPLGVGLAEAPPIEVPATRRFSAGSWVFIGVTLVLLGGSLYLWRSSVRARRSLTAGKAGKP